MNTNTKNTQKTNFQKSPLSLHAECTIQYPPEFPLQNYKLKRSSKPF